MQICPTYISKINLDYEKTNNSLSDPKQRKIRLALPFTNNKKKICCIERNDLKKEW